MLPPVTVAAEGEEMISAEATETVEIEETTEPVETEETETNPAETEPEEMKETTPVETEPEETKETTPVETEPEETEETAPMETEAETTEETEPEASMLPEAVQNVQTLVDALPSVDSVAAEDYDAVQEAYDAYEALTEEEKALIQGAEKFEALFGWFNGQISTLEAVASGTCGTNVNWVLTNDWTLTISGNGDMKDYDAREAPWYNNGYTSEKITAVVIKSGVTSIGKMPSMAVRIWPASLFLRALPALAPGLSSTVAT